MPRIEPLKSLRRVVVWMCFLWVLRRLRRQSELGLVLKIGRRGRGGGGWEVWGRAFLVVMYVWFES
jgi:hypothetical protein